MARDWYLMKPPHSQLSGFEDELMETSYQDGFDELLDSDIAIDVEICDCDLADRKKVKAIIQERVQDTKLKTLSRTMLTKIGTCLAGRYVYYKGRYWLIVGLVDDNTMYEKSIMVLCNYLLTWVNKNNQIIQRWCNVTSASQYNNGETSVEFYFTRSDQLMILTPGDDECLFLNNGCRFIIDRRTDVYEREIPEGTTVDTSNVVSTYKLTRADSVLFSYIDSGHYGFMATQDEMQDGDGYYLINGKGYWLCGKPSIVDKSTYLFSDIECDSNYIYNGIDGGMFTAMFYDENNTAVKITPTWTIDCDFADKLNVEYIGNSICISADDKKLINKSFELSLSADGYETVSKIITIRAFI